MSTNYTGDPANITTPLSKTVSDATNATPIVITTSAAHGYGDNDTVTITGVGGNTAANGRWKITWLTTTTFSLDSSVGNGAYTSGGTVYNQSLTPPTTSPSDGDLRSAASINASVQTALDRTQKLKSLITVKTRITGPGCKAIAASNAALTPSGTAFSGTWVPATITDVPTVRGGGVTQGQVTTGSAVSWGLRWCINDEMVHGATLVTATLGYDAAGGHGALPLVMPRFCIYRSPKVEASAFAGMLSTGDGCGVDTSANTTIFQAAHDITFTPNQNNVIDRETYNYFCLWFGEGHTNAIAGGIIEGLVLNFEER